DPQVDRIESQQRPPSSLAASATLCRPCAGNPLPSCLSTLAIGRNAYALRARVGLIGLGRLVMDARAIRFKARLERDVLDHPVIAANAYTSCFRRGEFGDAETRAFLIQFSVFSNQFLVAQLRNMLNADTREEMRESKEILANEIGVGFTARAN